MLHLDGVVYRDGTFIGADKTHVLERYVMARFAERDEVLAALNLINSSPPSPFVVVAQLQKMFNKEFQFSQGANMSRGTAVHIHHPLAGVSLFPVAYCAASVHNVSAKIAPNPLRTHAKITPKV